MSRHVLTVVAPDEDNWDGTVACLDFDGSCQTWWECKEPHDADDIERMENDQPTHGQQHQWINESWMTVQQPGECLASGMLDVNYDSVLHLPTGQHEVEIDNEDGTTYVTAIKSNPRQEDK